MVYQEQWDSLQTRASNLLSFLSQKCNKIHEVAAMHYANLVQFVEEDQKLYRGMIGSLLYLTASRPDILFSVACVQGFNQILEKLT